MGIRDGNGRCAYGGVEHHRLGVAVARVLTVAHAVRDWPARLGLVAAGLGLAVVPGMAAGTMPPGLQLVAVNDSRPVRRSVLAVTRPERSPSAVALVQALREEGTHITHAVSP